jgi:hypothetical protein
MGTTRTIAIGDWVNSYSPGIWRVYRILRVAHQMRFSLSDRRKKSRRATVFSRRIVDANWRPAFKTECCEESSVRPLSSDDKERLEDLLHANAELKDAFDHYAPEPQPFIVNLSMSIPDINQLEWFCERTLAEAMVSGVSTEEVLELLKAAQLNRFLGRFPINATLQMVCRDHEVRDGEFILRDSRVLPF